MAGKCKRREEIGNRIRWSTKSRLYLLLKQFHPTTIYGVIIQAVNHKLTYRKNLATKLLTTRQFETAFFETEILKLTVRKPLFLRKDTKIINQCTDSEHILANGYRLIQNNSIRSSVGVSTKIE